MTSTERTKMLRQERRAAGLCYQCGDRRPEPERPLCGPCLEVNRQRAKAQRESALLRGKCPECGGPSTREEVRVAAQKRRRFRHVRCKPCLAKAIFAAAQGRGR